MTPPDTHDDAVRPPASLSPRGEGPAGYPPAPATGESWAPESIRATGFAAFGLLKPLPAPTDQQRPVELLRDRVPAQAVMRQVLALQAQAAPRSWWGRLMGDDPLHPEARSWYQGAVGEIAVGEILSRLGPEWTVLHSVPVGAQGTDIDHVLIGPPGVFTLNTKNHAGHSVWVAGRTLTVAGHRQPHIPKASAEAARAHKLLTTAIGAPVPVAGALVLVNPRDLTIRQDPAGVAVLTDRQLLGWLALHPPVLSTVEVSTIAVIAARAATWSSAPLEKEDPAALQEAFGALDRQVCTARRRRRVWGFGVGGVRRGVRAVDRAEKAALRGLARLVLAMVFLVVAVNLLDSLA